MQERAYAKINLYLQITGQRDNGYHELDSLVVFAAAADRLTAEAAAELSLAITGPFASALQGDAADNLVLRAARAVWPQARLRLTLEKHLPVASGIGGGSADAAATLRLLRRFRAFDDRAIRLLAASLGADVPVCLEARSARMQGVGEILTASPKMPALGLVLVNCGLPVSTQAVFRAREGSFRPAAELPRGWGDAGELAASLSLLSNDLEAPALRLCPSIGEVLEALRVLPGCRLARMSGSGGTCFGLFDSQAAAGLALQAASWPPAWWRWSGGLHA